MSTRLLIIEDEDEIADFLVRGLREEGFTVERSADAIDGWARLNSGSWDLILLDWWLPWGDGLSLVRRYRQSGGVTPILFLTARDAVSDRVRGLNSGADGYLCKPFAFEELLARIRSLVRRPIRPAGTVLSFHDLKVDVSSQRVERAGVRLELTSTEFSLLMLFLHHPGEVLSRNRIYEHVWDEPFDGTSNTLEVHIVALRKALERHGPRLIQTVRGRGYQLALGPE